MNVSEGGVLKQQQQQHQQQHQQQTRKRDSPLCLLLVDLFRGCVWALLFFFGSVLCFLCCGFMPSSEFGRTTFFGVVFPISAALVDNVAHSRVCTLYQCESYIVEEEKKGKESKPNNKRSKIHTTHSIHLFLFHPFHPLVFFFFHCDETPGVMVSSVLHVLRGQADPYTVAIAGGFSVFWLSLYSRRPSFLAFSAIGFLPLLLLPDYSVTCQ